MFVLPQVAISSGSVAFGDGDVGEIARSLVAQGAAAVQLRDVDGTVARAPGKAGWLAELTASLGVPVQFDGALNDSHALEQIARLGFATIVVGQAAVFDPLFLRWAGDLLGRRMVVELLSDGDYLYDAPRAQKHLELVEAARMLRFQGVRHVLLRDVTGIELPLPRLRQLCVDVDIDVTFVGPVHTLGDLEELTVIDSPNLHSVVVGAPLIDGRISLADANQLFN